VLRIALANLAYPASPEDSVECVIGALVRPGDARIMCFPECYVPGYRGLGYTPPSVDASWLDDAWSKIGEAARAAKCAAIVGTERFVEGKLVATALVIDANGERLGFQDKVQIDPDEEGTYAPTDGRRVFELDGVTIGVVICHEGWRYPETVRFAARHGAQLVFHPHYSAPEPGTFRPTTFADPANTFHEKAALCRAAENTIYFASVNYATPGSPTTSVVTDPNGVAIATQPYGEAGVLIVDLDLAKATRLLANRCRS